MCKLRPSWSPTRRGLRSEALSCYSSTNATAANGQWCSKVNPQTHCKEDYYGRQQLYRAFIKSDFEGGFQSEETCGSELHLKAQVDIDRFTQSPQLSLHQLLKLCSLIIDKSKSSTWLNHFFEAGILWYLRCSNLLGRSNLYILVNRSDHWSFANNCKTLKKPFSRWNWMNYFQHRWKSQPAWNDPQLVEALSPSCPVQPVPDWE